MVGVPRRQADREILPLNAAGGDLVWRAAHCVAALTPLQARRMTAP